jgi:hypothetical protein
MVDACRGEEPTPMQQDAEGTVRLRRQLELRLRDKCERSWLVLCRHIVNLQESDHRNAADAMAPMRWIKPTFCYESSNGISFEPSLCAVCDGPRPLYKNKDRDVCCVI